MGVTRLLESMDDGDVRMVQRREDFRFSPESCDPFRVNRECFGKDLDGDFAIELRIARSIDLPHAADAERRKNLVWAESCTGGEGQTVRVNYTGVVAALRTNALLLRRYEELQLLGPVLHDDESRRRSRRVGAVLLDHQQPLSVRRDVERSTGVARGRVVAFFDQQRGRR